MINFRYHVVSLIAVFLALGVGVIMGTAVIDRAVVDRLERQQSNLNHGIAAVQAENRQLHSTLDAEHDAADKLADEGSQRLVNGVLAGTPVLVVAVRGADVSGLDDLETLLGRAAADYRGTLWLTDHFALDDDRSSAALAGAVGLPATGTTGALRSAGIGAVARALRPPTVPVPHDAALGVLGALRSAGFVDYEPSPVAKGQVLPRLDAGIRILVVTGSPTESLERRVVQPLLRALVVADPDRRRASVLVVSSSPTTTDDAAATLIGPIRRDADVAPLVSTVDDIDDFAGRLAAVLALGDLGQGRVGHFGTGPGAQRLLPAPAG